MEMVHQWIGASGLLLEASGVAVILLGILLASARALWRFRTAQRDTLFRDYRTRLGRSILLGLEFLVAGDIVSSVTVAPDLKGVAVLAIIVLIRTFLSFTLEVEMNGRWPWQGEPSRANGSQQVSGTEGVHTS